MFWYDGALHEEPIAPFDLTDRGLNLADGIFDTSLAQNGRIFLLEPHLDRFALAAEALAIPFSREAAADALGRLAAAIGQGAVRLTLTRGGGARGLPLPKEPKPFLFGAAAPAPAPFPVLALAVTSIRRNESSPAARLKTLAYLDAILALREASAKGAGEALFLNGLGHVASLSSANLFAVFGRRIVTPPLADGVLPGTVRALVLKRAPGLGFGAAEQSFDLAELSRADAIFATSSLKLIAPCGSLERHAFASAENEVVHTLQAALRDAIEAECGTT
ncbi:MAG TPA: aminotransferase class IV [Methylovirgula sp.]|nr:aminotransferase class IV [Methylovirgula sp.]